MSLPKWIPQNYAIAWPEGTVERRAIEALTIAVEALQDIQDEAATQGDECWWQDIRKSCKESLRRIEEIGK